MITQNVTLNRKVKRKTEQSFNPGLALIDLSGTGPGVLFAYEPFSKILHSFLPSSDEQSQCSQRFPANREKRLRC